ncbi:hypothetical protein D3C71_175250 [compost metagenome]
MSSDSITFASDQIGFGRDGAPAAAPTLAEPSTTEKSAVKAGPPEAKSSKLKSAGNAFSDLIMWIGVFITGGIFGLVGYRRVTALRLTIEAGIVAVFAGALYYTTKTWLHPYTDGVDMHDPLQRALLFVLGAIVLAYLGGMVVHVGWHRKGDPKVSMLVLAVGMTLIGLRIASVGMAFGEIKAVDAKVEAGAAGLTALKSTIEVMKAGGVDPKPVAKVILDFQKSVYGSKYIEGFYATSDKPKIEITPSDLEAPAAAAKPEKASEEPTADDAAVVVPEVGSSAGVSGSADGEATPTVGSGSMQ